MSKLCRQVSIESPGPTMKECVFSFDVPVPEVPMANRTRSASVCSTSSVSSVGSLSGEMENFGIHTSTPAHIGLRDGALFPGYEVAGVVDAIGKNADCAGIKEGDRIVLYPYEGVPHGYADYIVVPDFKCLVPVPAELPLSVAAMLPTGALLAMNTVNTGSECLKRILEGPNHKDKAAVLIVGTGGLALWALRIATHKYKDSQWHDCCKVVHGTRIYTSGKLIERTTDACGGPRRLGNELRDHLPLPPPLAAVPGAGE
ncbi:hypothetical protein MSG28_009194 [Choristoneura fumiferana]|uniref:Uncharacterized protein n=1 Tax=Choristoneura fumiferana TaxID=7141 RepID=A0ACC0KX05_CHOFU|nr:hypothetical protein MSG28_009194 [Choristoneura fumiferana]